MTSPPPAPAYGPDGADGRLCVIVPAHNAGDTLGECLDAIARSKPVPDEIIIADDGSTDGAPQRLAAGRPGVRVIRTAERPAGPAAARNAAVAATSAGILVFTDADVRVHPDAIARLAAPVRDEPGVAAAFGSYDDRPPPHTIASVYANLRHHHVHQRAPAEAVTFWSGLGAVRRASFLAAGGYDRAFARPSIEDVELGLRLRRAGGRIRLVREAQGTHLKRWTVRSLWRTDLRARAVPWARLSVTHPELRSALNAGTAEKLAVLCLVGALGLAALAVPAARAAGWPAVAGSIVALIAGWAIINAGLLRLLLLRGGPRALLGGAALHAVYYLTSAAVFVAVSARERIRQGVAAPRAGRAARLMWAALILMVLAAAGSLAALAVADTTSLLRRLTALEPHRATPRFSADELRAMQTRAAIMAGVLMLPAGGLVITGPRRLARGLCGAAETAINALCMPLAHAAVIAAVTAGSAAIAGINLGQQMRLDEAASYAMYARASPMAALATYDTPNNHVLHSALMWCSVRILGSDEWAVRLPAYLISLTLPLLTYTACRAVLTPAIGLLAAPLVCLTPAGVDLATNARGYPMILAAMLALLALLPALRMRRPGAAPAAVAVGAVGLYAVPVMAFPLGVFYIACLALGPAPGRSRAAHTLRACVMGLASCAAVGLLYSPVWILGAGQDPTRTLARVIEPSAGESVLRWRELSYNLTAAWEQWTWPAGTPMRITLLVIAVGGLVAWIVRGGASRALAAGVLVGTPAVYLAAGLAPPPWWAMVWFMPLAAMMLATPAAAALSRLPRPHAPAAAIAAAAAGLTLASGYPEGWPHWVGYRDAPAVARHLASPETDGAVIATRAQWYRSVIYELAVRAIPRDVDELSAIDPAPGQRLLHIRDATGDRDPELDALAPELASRLRLTGSTPIGGSLIDSYIVDETTP